MAAPVLPTLRPGDTLPIPASVDGVSVLVESFDAVSKQVGIRVTTTRPISLSGNLSVQVIGGKIESFDHFQDEDIYSPDRNEPLVLIITPAPTDTQMLLCNIGVLDWEVQDWTLLEISFPGLNGDGINWTMEEPDPPLTVTTGWLAEGKQRSVPGVADVSFGFGTFEKGGLVRLEVGLDKPRVVYLGGICSVMMPKRMAGDQCLSQGDGTTQIVLDPSRSSAAPTVIGVSVIFDNAAHSLSNPALTLSITEGLDGKGPVLAVVEFTNLDVDGKRVQYILRTRPQE